MPVPRGRLETAILVAMWLCVIASHSENVGDADRIVEEAAVSQDVELVTVTQPTHKMPDGMWMRGSSHVKPQEEMLVAPMDSMNMEHTMKHMERKSTTWASPGYYKDPVHKKGWVPGHNMGMMDSHGMLGPIECHLRGASLALANEPDKHKFKQIRAALQGFKKAAIDTPIKHVGMDGYYGCVICSKTCRFMLSECVNQPWGHPAKHSDIMTFLHTQGGMAKYNHLQQLVAKDKTFSALTKQREEVVCSMHM